MSLQRSSIARLFTCGLLALFLSGCTTSVTVEGTVPTPLVAKIPARIGIHFPEEFKTFTYKEVVRETGTYKIDLGEQNLDFFRNLYGSMFSGVSEVGEPPLPDDSALDGMVVTRIVKYGFLTPAISGLKFFSASIQYQITIYDAAGDKVGDWNIVGYGKSEGGAFQSEDALGEATLLAIRDGGARIAIELRQQPQVRAWIESLEAQGETGP